MARLTDRTLWDMHAYIFTYHADGDDIPHFERTMPVACLRDAHRWIAKSGRNGFVSVDCLPPHYWY